MSCTTITLKFKMCLVLGEASYWAEKLLKDIQLLPLMPDEDNNFGGSLVLDFRKWWHHVQYKNRPRVTESCLGFHLIFFLLITSPYFIMHNGVTVHMERLLEAITVRATQTTFLSTMQPPWNITSLNNLFFGHICVTKSWAGLWATNVRVLLRPWQSDHLSHWSDWLHILILILTCKISSQSYDVESGPSAINRKKRMVPQTRNKTNISGTNINFLSAFWACTTVLWVKTLLLWWSWGETFS